MLRGALIALALLAAAPAAAAPFPDEGERWMLSVRAPGPAGHERFARVYAEPTHGSRWAVDVTCGVVDVRTGREHVDVRGDGFAARARSGYLGGTYVPKGGGETSGFSVDQEGEALADLPVVFGPGGCPTGPGTLSTGD